MLGLFKDFRPRFVTRYADLSSLISQAVEGYADEVRTGRFPAQERSRLSRIWHKSKVACHSWRASPIFSLGCGI
ncbi:3-methyl-2-oxobutanoate hydroxymethyltransferase [Rhizobium sp. 2YAF20]|uniref:3-methyl-2-oxobutanoate hydroxymethyltransferase n=1 Tax=Rhizobium sp. 2YAF20 TaxID=3233027 RepID=UPI003F97321F